MTNYIKQQKNSQATYKNFKASKLALVVMITTTTIMICLGFWQINRGNYKKNILINHHKTTPINIAIKDIDQNNSITITDHFNCNGKKILFVDLQHLNHQLGYHVLMPCEINHLKKTILINLGWISQQQTNKIKKYQRKFNNIKLKGYLRKIQHNPFINQNPITNSTFPQIVQGVEADFIEKIIKQKITPAILLISKEQNFGFEKNWQINSLSPQRHYFYAAQWFLFALISAIIFIHISINRDKKCANN